MHTPPEGPTREKLLQLIGDWYRSDHKYDWLADRVIALLWPAPQQTIDREAARDVLRQMLATHDGPHEDAVLDALETCFRPAPKQTIDRDALVRRLEQYAEECGIGEDDPTPGAASDILALLQPDDDFTLTREDWAVSLPERERHGYGPWGGFTEQSAREFVRTHPAARVMRRTVRVGAWEPVS